MAYTRVNLLERIIEIQEITLSEKQRGASQKWIYINLIRRPFRISERTYNRYLGIPAKKQLKELLK
jgi:hypothetical protein